MHVTDDAEAEGGPQDANRGQDREGLVGPGRGPAAGGVGQE